MHGVAENWIRLEHIDEGHFENVAAQVEAEDSLTLELVGSTAGRVHCSCPLVLVLEEHGNGCTLAAVAAAALDDGGLVAQSSVEQDCR